MTVPSSAAPLPVEFDALDVAGAAALAISAQADEWPAAARQAAMARVQRHLEAMNALHLKLLAAERRAGTWGLHGDRDMAGFVGRQSHQGRGAGAAAVAQAETLEAMPAVAGALVGGAVTVMHVAQIARATAASPGLAAVLATPEGQAEVVRLAARLDGAEFGKALRHEVASLDPASRQREHDEQRANRSLVMTQTPGGTLFKGRLDAVAGHKLAKAIDALCPRPALHDERTREQRHADALMVMVEHTLADRSTTPGAVAPVQAILTVDQATWAALRAEDWPRGEVAARTPGGGGEAEAASAGDLGPGAGSSGDVLPRLAGVPAVTDETGQAWPASEIARALCDCSLTRAVIGAESETLDLGRDSRLFKRRHWLALYAAGVRGCGIDGCGTPLAYCELHHVRWWYEHGGRTDLANCVPYCSFHHHEVHRRDLRVVRRADGSYEHRHPDGRRYGGAPRGDEHLAGCSPMPAVAGVRAGTGVPSAAPDDPPPADLLDLLPARPDDNGAERPGRRGSRGWHGAVVRVRDGTADTRGDGGVPPGVPSLVTS